LGEYKWLLVGRYFNCVAVFGVLVGREFVGRMWVDVLICCGSDLGLFCSFLFAENEDGEDYYGSYDEEASDCCAGYGSDWNRGRGV
jgi:hypothetical protein